MTRIYYIVQTAPTLFLHGNEKVVMEGFGADDAARLSFGQAARLCREIRARSNRADGGGECARRFPRVLKVSIEMKTITPKRKGA